MCLDHILRAVVSLVFVIEENTMGLAIILLPVAFIVVISNNGVESAGCPPAHKVPGYKQTCYGNYDCKNGQICCPNQSHTKSCTYPAPYLKLEKPKRESSPLRMFIKADIILERADDQLEDVNAGVYCDGVKCLPWEVCLPDPYTKKLKCQLPYSQNEISNI